MGFDQKVRRTSLLESLAAEMEGRILDGRLAVGERLPAEGVLAAEYQVSRPLLREALSKLRARGFLKTLTGRGTYVCHPGPGHLADVLLQQARLASDEPLTADHLYEARLAIEVLGSRLAAENSTPEVLDILRQQLADMRLHAEDATAYTAADVGFHLAIAKASGNPLLPALLSPLVQVIVSGVFVSHGAEGATEAGIRAHAQILAAIESGDAKKAQAAITRHLVESRTFFPDSALSVLAEGWAGSPPDSAS